MAEEIKNDKTAGVPETINTEIGGAAEAVRGRSRKKPGSGKKAAMIAGAAVLCLALAGGGAYVALGQKYKTVFFPNTIINGLDASGLTVDEVKELIDAGMDGYVLTVETREGTQEQIFGEAIGLHAEYDGTLEQLLAEQNPMHWGKHLKNGVAHTFETMVVYDEEKLAAQVAALDCLAEGKPEPKNAYLSEYIAGSGYQIIPEEPGAVADAAQVLSGVIDGILNMQERISLEELDVYVKPAVTSEDPGLGARAEAWNRYVNTTVTYRFGSRTEVLDGERIHTWLSDDGQGGVVLDEEAVGAYVSELGKKYNTAYQPKTLKTSYGPTVTINQGFYGWRINQGAEKAALIEILRSGESQEREPVYSQTAASRDGNDYGDTYVEINLTAQHLFFYKDGKLLVEADFVSGNASRGWDTPAGAYPLTYKERNATLRGENYATPVSYWMPFNGNIGMHDASWRGSFGGTIYKTNGSHGCVNLPPSAAKTIYENISAGMPVLCYHLSGTEKGSSKAPAETKPAETTAAPVETTAAPVETTAAPAQTTASPETKPAQGGSHVIEAGGGQGGPGATEPETTASAGSAGPGGSETQGQAPAEPNSGPSGQSSGGPGETGSSSDQPGAAGPGGSSASGGPSGQAGPSGPGAGSESGGGPGGAASVVSSPGA